MTQPNQIEIWLNSVAYEHSQSKATENQYKRVWNEFSKSTNMTAENIIQDYENAEKNNISERTIKRKHSQKIQQWIIQLTRKGLTTTSIKVMVGAVMSFYKYNDLPLGHIPQAKSGITYHNRDITKDEINKIIALSPIRERAIFATMAQSGLRPHTIKQLKIKHLRKILEENTPIPLKINIPAEIEKGKFGTGHPTFTAEEAIKYTKQYLNTRTNLTPESLLFCSQTNQEQPVNTKNISRTFRISAQTLKETGAINYEIRKGKPSELRLYNLRNYFRKYANQMGFEHVNYLMNHTTKGSDNNYTPKDDDFYEKLYTKQAMEFLTFDKPTPTETTEIMKIQKEQHQKEMETIKNQYKNEIEKLTERLTKIENILPKEPKQEEPPSKYWEEMEYLFKEHQKAEKIRKKWEKEHPEELKQQKIQQEERNKEFDKYLDEHPEIAEQNEKQYNEHLETRINELEKIIKELKETIQNK